MEDIVQETIRRVIERAQKVVRGEVSPILSFKQMATMVAYNYYRDLKCHDYRLSRLDATDAGMHSAHCYPVDVYSDEYLLGTVAEKVDQESLFDVLAGEIGHFPPKQKQAILIDLTNRMYFDAEPTSLQESFLLWHGAPNDTNFIFSGSESSFIKQEGVCTYRQRIKEC